MRHRPQRTTNSTLCAAFAAANSTNSSWPTTQTTAGRKAALRAWTLLTPSEAEHATVAMLPDGADPAQLVQDGLARDLNDALTTPRPLIDVLVETVMAGANLDRLEGRVGALRTIAHAVAPLSVDAIARTQADLATRLKGLLVEDTITDELINAHLDHRTATSRPLTEAGRTPRRSQVPGPRL